ncbi:glycosyl hydrolase [bacterium]|nr:glycosyl hydrolase [bacterium]
MVFTLTLFIIPESSQAKSTDPLYPKSLYRAMKWRCIGPYRGGRVTAVAGVSGKPYTYFFGATGGGVWKTVDGGKNWKNVSDGFFQTGSVGAVAISEWDPNVVYVGMGEAPIRGNVSHGDGMYKSTDGGKTWTHIGLSDAGQISRVRIHPRNPDLVYAAVLGHVYGPSEQRGVFRSQDGGKTWEKILFQSEKAGAIDLILDPNNPRNIYAAFWEASRTPYKLVSGGPGSGLFKSTDGGDTWEEISRNKGLPQGVLGKIGVTVSPAKPDRVWAIIEAEKGGVFRSDDGGKTWIRVNKEQKLRQRAWYYSRIYADPQDPNTMYVLNTGLYRSVDGGKTYESIRVPHGDNHDLWIAPENPDRMINGNDGGANVSFDGGESWTEQDQPTAQFYHVNTDDRFPYYVYGAQQDNSTVCIPNRTSDSGIDRSDWYAVGGGESGHIAPKPGNPNIVYAGSYGGLITRYNHKTNQRQAINPWPVNPMGWGAAKLKYRFQWTAPIVVSQHNPEVIYHAAQVLFKSTNGGHSWERISPDLTTNDKSKQGPSGGPITHDNTSVEYYCTIYALAESPHDPDILWVGSDDGLVHITKNGGKDWEEITPENLPEWSMISMIEPSTFDEGTAYMAVDRHKLDDFKPYIYKTENFGKSWKKISEGIPPDDFVRVVREDPKREGLLYVGTETGVYVSFDDGGHWQSLQLNLPAVPVRDLRVKRDDLVAATHGRSFWILDDLTPLHQITDEVARSQAYLFEPKDAYRVGGRSYPRPNAGKNPPSGSVIHYYFKEKPSKEVTLEILDDEGNLIRRFSSKKEKVKRESPSRWSRVEGNADVPVQDGMNRFVWNMRYPGAQQVPGAVLWGGTLRGPEAIPGTYKVKLTVGDKEMVQSWEWKKDPRISTTQEEYKKQFDFLIEIRDKVSEVNKAINRLRRVKKQVHELTHKVKELPQGEKIIQKGKTLLKKLQEIEDVLIQSKSESPQDPLNYPIKLDNQIAALASVVASADAAPTEQSYEAFQKLSEKADAQLAKLEEVLNSGIPALNQMAKEANVPLILIEK